MKKILLFTIMLLMSSCVLDSEYQKVIKENQKLKDEIEEIKYGIPTLLEEAQTFFRIGNFLESKNRIDTLMKKYPTAVETIMAKKMLPAIEEELLWNKINEQNDLVLVQKYERKYPKGKYNKDIKNKKNEILLQIDKEAYERATNSNTISEYNNYLQNFPKGKFRWKVKTIISKIKKEDQKKAYETAKRKNTSYAWKNFLKEYPKHWDKYNIKQKIIKLEVDEIMRTEGTGRLPSFSQTNYGYSSTSSVTIKNDTRYQLTVRYSGKSIKKIVIPIGGTRTTKLSSGVYKIAASAGGLHYAGRENLSGSYTSTYYITSSYY